MTYHEQASAWRRAMRLTRQEMSDLTGYSPSAIVAYERGTTTQGLPHDARCLRRYKLTCLAVHMLRGAGRELDQWEWGR